MAIFPIDPKRLLRTPPFVQDEEDVVSVPMGRRVNLPTGVIPINSSGMGAEPPPPVDTRPRSVMPGAGMETPPFAGGRTRGRYADPINAARESYVYGDSNEQGRVPRTVGGTLKSALSGFLQGMGQGGGIGNALGGAAGGAAGALISPEGARRGLFEQTQRPALEQATARKQAEAARQQTNARFEQQGRLVESQILENESQAAERNRPKPPAPPPRPVSSPRGLYDPTTRGIIPGTEPLPPPPKERETKLVTFENKTYDYNDPAQRSALEKAQNAVPRDKFGRYRSRADDRTSSRAAGGNGTGGSRAIGEARVDIRSYQKKVSRLNQLTQIAGSPQSSDADRQAAAIEIGQLRGEVDSDAEMLQEMGVPIDFSGSDLGAAGQQGPGFNEPPQVRTQRRRERPSGQAQPRSNASKVATMSDVKRKAQERGVSVSEAEAAFKKAGYTIR